MMSAADLDDRLDQIERWFRHAKDAVRSKDYENAWSWANQGQLYTQQLRADLAAQLLLDPRPTQVTPGGDGQ